eukprot:c7133_g1_i1.p1 GENE.c7133_g1_i1~~c7133_g1_i1.p1  ORF type:complete len:177 (-),score=42.14 c7133_g1_i1:73-534(-)
MTKTERLSEGFSQAVVWVRHAADVVSPRLNGSLHECRKSKIQTAAAIVFALSLIALFGSGLAIVVSVFLLLATLCGGFVFAVLSAVLFWSVGGMFFGCLISLALFPLVVIPCVTLISLSVCVFVAKLVFDVVGQQMPPTFIVDQSQDSRDKAN